MENYSEIVHLSIYDSLPDGLKTLITQPQRSIFGTIGSPTTKDEAIIAMGVLSANLNNVLSTLLSQTSIAELMMFAASQNPIQEGILLGGLALHNPDFKLDYTTMVTPITQTTEDENGEPVETVTGKTVAITPSVSGVTSDKIASVELDVPGLGKYAVSVGETIDLDLDLSVPNLAGKVYATLKDGVTVAKDFYLDLAGSIWEGS